MHLVGLFVIYYFIINEFNKNFILKESLKSVVTGKSTLQSLPALWAELQYILLVPVWIVLQDCTWVYNVIKSYKILFEITFFQ